MSVPDTLGAALGRALDAYDALGLLGEEVEDEWTYVTDLATAWRGRLAAIAAARGEEPLDESTTTAFDVAIEEIGRIEDPNRAIDWLSTFPQVILLLLGEEG